MSLGCARCGDCCEAIWLSAATEMVLDSEWIEKAVREAKENTFTVGSLTWDHADSDPIADVRAYAARISSDEYMQQIAEYNRQLAQEQARWWAQWEIAVRREAEERGITYEERVKEIWEALPEHLKIRLLGGDPWGGVR